MKIINLTKGKETLVDDADYEYLNQFKWKVSSGNTNKFYAIRNQHIKGSKNKCVRIAMHRLLMGVLDNPKVIIDHKDGDSLNNQRSNLRECTFAQNTQNSRPRNKSVTKYKGVIKERRGNLEYWRARIKVGDKYMSLGYFKEEKEAAVAYNNAATEHFKEFANLNII